LDQLDEALRRAHLHQVVDHDEIQKSASQHGEDLFHRGLTVAQVVHDYGDLCQVIAGLAVEQEAPIAPEDFRTLNLCLDDAIAGAVTAYAKKREQAISDAGTEREREIADAGTERLGVLAHEMRNVLSSAMLAFNTIKAGTVAIGGATGAVLGRSLIRLNALIDRSLADVRLDAGIQNVERIPVCEILEEVAISASMVAQTRKLTFVVTTVDPTVIVEADRQILAATIANLLQNALKFTHDGTTVRLRAQATATRVLIEVEDECGGLPEEKYRTLLEPFVQRGGDRTGLGLGLYICRKAVKMMAGELRIRDLRGKGCVFTIDLPRQPPPPISLQGRERRVADAPTSTAGGRGSARHAI
jgi:hypothetical protein